MAISDLSPSLHRRKRYYGKLLMPPLHPTGLSLVKSLITLSQQIIDAQNHKLCQRRNLSVLSRRIKILLMFLDEVRDTASTLPPSALLCFSELHVVLQGIKLLSQDCAESSIICLLMEHRRMSEFFHRIMQEMATALEILPLELLDVSCEVREQLELMRKQAKRAKLYVDAKEARLCADVRFAMAQIERKEAAPEVSKLAEIFNSLELKSTADFQRELDRLRAEEIESMWDVIVSTGRNIEDRKVPLSDLISFVRYCKCVLYGVTEIVDDDDMSDGATVDEADGEEPDIKIPDDFRCPISLELMRDPVIVATGQTYDRAEITRWINGNNHTCPKSGLKLVHTTLIPNYALRNLIRQWCVRHNVRFRIPRAGSQHRSCCASLSTPAALEATKLTAEFLLRQLSLASPDTQRHIAGELRVLAKCGSDNRKVIADAGAIPLLIPLLWAADARTKEHAVTAILNLSIYAPNKERIVNVEGALDGVIKLMRSQIGEVTEATRENAAAVLFSLSQVTEAAAEMGRKAEAMEGLLQIVKEGSVRGKRDAASALFNMAVYGPNRASLVKAGTMGVIIEVLSTAEKGGIEEEGLSLLAVLAGVDEGRREIAMSESAPTLLVDALRTGSPKGKENAAATLLGLCRYESSVVRAKMYSALPLLHSLLLNGTPRARRKAASLLRILLR